MFKERKKFALLSLLSALVVVSTAFVGISIYAQTDDSELTTFEEEAIAAGADMEDTGLEDTDTATSDDNATEDTTIADLSFLDGLVLCDLGTTEVLGETQTAAFDNASLTTPTVSVEMMTGAEVAELVSNETSTASADNETSISSAACVLMGESNSTSTTANGNATDGANATSTASSNATLTGADNATSLDSLGTSNETSTASAPEYDGQILVIEGQDFVPEQAVLIFSEGVLVGIDEVAEDGSIEAMVPMPDGGETATAGNDTASTELRFVETGTQRTATFDFDGETLTAAEAGDIEAEGGDGATAQAPSGNATSTNSTSSNYTVQ